MKVEEEDKEKNRKNRKKEEDMGRLEKIKYNQFLKTIPCRDYLKIKG